MRETKNKYIPALEHDWLTRLYDPLMRWIMPEDRFKRRLIEQAQIQRGYRVLDLGCGTATLTILIKQIHTESEVVGLDGDPKVLKFARAKAAKAGVDIDFDLGMAYQLPYTDDSFDCVLSSLLLHHLTRENRVQTLKEVFRVLRPGGELHVADFGKPHNALMYLISQIIRRLEEASDNISGLLPEMFREVGFDQIRESVQYMTMFGTLSLYRARKAEVEA